MRLSLLIIKLALVSFCHSQHANFDYYPHLLTLDINSNQTNYIRNFIGEDLDGTQVFFVGETHGIQNNDRIAFLFLKYFHKYNDVKYCMLEMPHSFAWSYNQELQRDSLNPLLEKWPLLKLIYHYNKNLPRAKRIRFFGVDIERFPRQSITVVHDILNQHPVKTELIAPAEKVEAAYEALINNRGLLTDSTQQIFTTAAHLIQRELAADSLGHHRDFEDDYINLELIIENYIATLTSSWGNDSAATKTSQIKKREEAMFRSFCKVYPHLKGNTFGQFGSRHARLDTIGLERLDSSTTILENTKPFAYQLNSKKDSPVSGKVTSIGCNYYNSYTSQLNREINDTNKVRAKSILPIAMENEILQHTQGDFTLIKLDGSKNPYDEIAKQFKYIIFIKDQTPLVSDH